MALGLLIQTQQGGNPLVPGFCQMMEKVLQRTKQKVGTKRKEQEEGGEEVENKIEYLCVGNH